MTQDENLFRLAQILWVAIARQEIKSGENIMDILEAWFPKVETSQ